MVCRSVPSTAVRKILSAERMGEECPSGSGVAQITLVSGPTSVGRFEVSATPFPFGPRQRDQSSAAPAAVSSPACLDHQESPQPHGHRGDHQDNDGKNFGCGRFQQHGFLTPIRERPLRTLSAPVAAHNAVRPAERRRNRLVAGRRGPQQQRCRRIPAEQAPLPSDAGCPPLARVAR